MYLLDNKSSTVKGATNMAFKASLAYVQHDANFKIQPPSYCDAYPTAGLIAILYS